MSRVFLMKWYHFSVEYFEDLRNINHCEFLIMRKEGESGKYVLENQLRTWSALRRERAALKQKEEEESKHGSAHSHSNGSVKEHAKLEKAASSPVIAQRRWGGCPNGCNHDKNFKIRSGLMDLVKRDGVNVYPKDSGSPKASSPATNGSPTVPHLAQRRPTARRFQSSGTDDGDNDDDATPLANPSHVMPPMIDVTKAREEIVSSPDATPSFISANARLRSPNGPFLHVGRDGGGTYSGHTSDADSSEDELAQAHRRKLRLATTTTTNHHHHHRQQQHPNGNGTANGHAHHAHHKGVLAAVANGIQHLGLGPRRKSMANRLGDAPHCSDCEHDEAGEHSDEREPSPPPTESLSEAEAELVRAEKEENSVAGSVY
jgi:hypothetical protein